MGSERCFLFLKEINRVNTYSKYTEQNYKHNTFVFAPIFHELNSKTFSMYEE